MSDARPPSSAPSPQREQSLLDRLVRQARWTLTFERLWPVTVLAGGLAALFVALAWLGAWTWAPRWIRIAGVALFALGFGAAAVLAWRRGRVSRRDALHRLDRDSGLGHQPVSSTEDRLAGDGADPLTRALWELAGRRREAVLSRVRVKTPSPRLVERDPYAVRLLAVLALVAAAFVAGDHKDGLIAAAFDWRGSGAAAPGFRVDAWVDPPGYTGKAPVVLMAGSSPAGSDQTVAVPVRSTVVVRSAGQGGVDVVASAGLKAVEAAKPGGAPAKPEGAGVERRFTLEGTAHLTLTHGGDRLAAVTLTAIPDRPPTIALTGDPRATDHGGLTLAYTIDDDYGVTSAEAAFTDPTMADRPSTRSLVPPPKLDLNLPPTPGGLGAGQTTGDLSDHPWAGAAVTVVLSTKDEGGNIGLSPPRRMTLPARVFHNPLARALVEQRRDLVLDPDHRDGIATALDALMVDPDRFTPTKAIYLGLYTARQRLAGARNDDDLIALADYLWQMALSLEDDDKSQTARDLQAAEQALREALQRNAPPADIKALTDALRRQMDKLLAEMAQQDRTAQNQAPDPNARVVTQDQLRKMMDRMAQMAQSGDKAEAQRMLDQLQAMLDNLRTARNGGQNQVRRDMNKQMSELDKMTREQQALRDKTFKQGQSDDDASTEPDDDANAQPQDGQPKEGQPKAGDPSGADMQRQQQALRQRLGELQQRMRQLGLKGEKGLEDAEQAMKDAEGALAQGKPGNRQAVDAQGRALQGLQQGANGVAQQMAQGGPGGDQDGQNEGEGSGGPPMSQGASGENGTDPLGRPRDGRGTMETRGRPLDEGVAERAQRVLEELRRRLGDPNRSSEEMEYLERLLQRY